MTMKKEPKFYMITEEVLSQIRKTIGSRIPETGGILGSSDGKHIDYFYFDKTANVTGATYEPDCNELNPVIRRWHEEGIEFVGFIHSHPRGAIKPSNPDNLYTKKIMKALDMEYFVSLIMQVHRSLKGEKATFSGCFVYRNANRSFSPHNLFLLTHSLLFVASLASEISGILKCGL